MFSVNLFKYTENKCEETWAQPWDKVTVLGATLRSVTARHAVTLSALLLLAISAVFEFAVVVWGAWRRPPSPLSSLSLSSLCALVFGGFCWFADGRSKF